MYFRVECGKISVMKRKIIIICTVVVLLVTSIVYFSCRNRETENVNLVIQVEFSDTQKKFSQADSSILAQAFNGSKNSLDNFIYVNSNGNRSLKSKVLGVVKID